MAKKQTKVTPANIARAAKANGMYWTEEEFAEVIKLCGGGGSYPRFALRLTQYFDGTSIVLIMRFAREANLL